MHDMLLNFHKFNNVVLERFFTNYSRYQQLSAFSERTDVERQQF